MDEQPIYRTIWKYRLNRTDETIIDMPRGAIPRCAACKDGGWWVWVEVDIMLPHVPHRFQVVGTGHEKICGGTYVGTMFDVPYVWHVYFHGEVQQ